MTDLIGLVNQTNKKTRDLLIKNWTEENAPLGKELGYPACCVEAFCNQPPELLRGKPSKEDKLRYEASHISGEYTGFIPCAKHAKQIKSGEIELGDLIQDRTHPSPFPRA